MKYLVGAAAAVMGIVLLSGGASATSLEVVLQRLDGLERENAALRERVRRLEGEKRAVKPAPAPIMASASPPMVTKVPAAIPYAGPMSVYDWSGVHVGVFSGYAVGGRWLGDATDYPHQPVNGWFGGVLAGYDHQFANNWVLGVEADVSAADIKQTDNYIDGAFTLRVDNLGTLRGRLGYAWDRTLVYATGGLAWAHMSVTGNQYHPGGPGSLPFQATDDHMHYGYAVGAGAQWAVLDNISFKIEYLWIDLAQQAYTFRSLPTSPA